MAGKFELYKDKAGKHRWRLKAGNGEIILASQGYASKAGAKNGIESVRKNSADAKRFRVAQTKNKKHCFTLVAGNSQVVGTSQTYDTEASCKAGIKSVARNAPKAKLVDA
ncbi:MAG: YegP family protein [Pseudomonadota bacterium]